MRGIVFNEEVKQHLDDYITPVVDKKLKSMEGGEKWADKIEDMKKLRELHFKHLQKQPLTKDDLTFLYEIDRPIQSSGYGTDPRIAELRRGRNTEEDMAVIFECRKDQIAYNTDDINENSVAYIGKWNPTILETVRQYPDIKYLYESFPDKQIFLKTIATDPTIQTSEQAEKRIKGKAIHLTDWGKDILYKTKFSKTKETYELVRFTVEQLGFPNGATTDEIYKKAESFGLELCPAEVGPHLCLSYEGGKWMLIAMKQITDRDGYPSVFSLDRGAAELKLGASYAKPERGWHSVNQFVFLLRKKKL